MSQRSERVIRNKKSKQSTNIIDDIIDSTSIINQKEENNELCTNNIVIKYAKKKDRKILLRKKELFDHLNDNKLEYIKNGICDSYIKYGTPSLKDVINNIQSKSEVQMKRLTKLINRLKEEGEIYDEKISYYAQYVKRGGDLEYTINEGIKEWFYVNKTNYLELLKIYKEEDKAQAKAFNTYIKNYGADKYTERIVKSEMVVRLF
jgi:hypothetical protein